MDNSVEKEQLLAKKTQYQSQLEKVEELLKTNPDPKLHQLKTQMIEFISMVDLSLAKLNPVKEEVRPEIKSEDGNWEIGDECEALFADDGLYYPAIISGSDEYSSDLTVTYVGYGNSAQVELKNIRKPTQKWDDSEPMDSKDIKVGIDCRVRYIRDGCLHDAVIDTIINEKVRVYYKKLNIYETVRMKDIKKKKVDKKTMDPFEACKILPTDSAHVQRQKKKTLRQLNYQKEIKEQEDIFKEKQNSWKNFQKKNEKKKTTTGYFMVPVNKESRAATNEKTMTPFPEKKRVFF
ncbi:hypothetical protein WA158_007955 [Blastocystis sp. Blastoise]